MYDAILEYVDINYTIAFKNGKSGLVDVNTGEPLTEFIYDIIEDEYPSDFLKDYANNFEGIEGFDEIYNENEKKPYLIMTKGMLEDYCAMRKNGKWGILNIKGETVIDFIYETQPDIVCMHQNEYYVINLEGKEGVLDLNSNIVIEPAYDYIIPTGNYWKCKKDEHFGLADKNGELVTQIKYESIRAYGNSDYFTARKNSKLGIVTLKDEIVVDFIYHTLRRIDKNGTRFIAKRSVNGKWGLINNLGEILLDFKYDTICDCMNQNGENTLLAYHNGKDEIFNTDGEKLWD